MSQSFIKYNVSHSDVIIRKSILGFMKRITSSNNDLVCTLVNSNHYFNSSLFKYWAFNLFSKWSVVRVLAYRLNLYILYIFVLTFLWCMFHWNKYLLTYLLTYMAALFVMHTFRYVFVMMIVLVYDMFCNWKPFCKHAVCIAICCGGSTPVHVVNKCLCPLENYITISQLPSRFQFFS